MNQPLMHKVFDYYGFKCFLSREPISEWQGTILIPRNHPWYGANPADIVTVAPLESGRFIGNMWYRLTFKSEFELRDATAELQLKRLAQQAKRVTKR